MNGDLGRKPFHMPGCGLALSRLEGCLRGFFTLKPQFGQTISHHVPILISRAIKYKVLAVSLKTRKLLHKLCMLKNQRFWNASDVRSGCLRKRNMYLMPAGASGGASMVFCRHNIRCMSSTREADKRFRSSGFHRKRSWNALPGKNGKTPLCCERGGVFLFAAKKSQKTILQ